MIYRFGSYSLDPARLELRDEEALLTVEPQVFALLAFLIKNRDRVVTKEEIIEAVWDGRIVSDGTLNSRINAARRALGDDGKAQAMIRTLPRRGFRFIAEVDDNIDTTQTLNSTVHTMDKPYIAVLPFDNMSDDSEQEYFSDGLADDIISALTQFRQLSVVARNSSFFYKGASVNVHEVGKELGVRYVLQGSVRKSGTRVRISVQLIDGQSGNHIWAERYDRNLEEIFAVQDEITESVVGAVEPELTKSEIIRVRTKKPENLNAWELYLQGTHYTLRRSKGDIAKAIQILEQAIDADPNFAPAYQGLSYAYLIGSLTGEIDDPEKFKPLAVNLAETAQRLERDDDRSHLALARALIFCGRKEEAFAAIQEALGLNPASASNHSLCGRILNCLDRAEEGLKYAEEALRLSPRDILISPFLVTIAESHFVLGNYETAIDWADKALRETDAIFYPAALKIVAYVRLSRMNEAGQAVGALIERFPDVTLSSLAKRPFPAILPNSKDFIEVLNAAGLPEK